MNASIEPCLGSNQLAVGQRALSSVSVPVWLALLLAFVFAGCQTQPRTGRYSREDALNRITSIAPSDWKLVERRENQVPNGFYDLGVRGELFVFAGPLPNYFHYRSQTGDVAREALAKESVNVWVMPDGFKPRQPWLDFHRRKPAEKVYSGRGIQVFGLAEHWLTISEEEFLDKIRGLPKVSPQQTWWSGLNFEDLSWKNWRVDIRRSLKE